MLDTSSNGYIHAEDVGRLLARLGMSVSESELEALIHKRGW